MYLDTVSILVADELLGLDIKLGNPKSLIQQASKGTTMSNSSRTAGSGIIVGKATSTLGRRVPLSNQRNSKAISEAVPDVGSHTVSVGQANGMGLVQRVLRSIEQVATDLSNVLDDGDIVPAAIFPKVRRRELFG